MALSMSNPVGFPFFKTTSPPAILVPECIPARFKAAALAKIAWPSMRFKITGLSGNRALSSVLSGNS